jgi:hypothetical protein
MIRAGEEGAVMEDFFDLPPIDQVRKLYDVVGKTLEEVEAFCRGHMGGPDIKKAYQDRVRKLGEMIQDLKKSADRLREKCR